MGFLSGLSGILGGGSQAAGSSASGFSQLPSEIQNAYKTYGTQVNNQIPSALTAYTPIPQTAGETQAYGSINQGFTPNQSQLNSDIQMQMNPYNSGVLNQIQRQAYGDNSMLKSALTAAGQYGSNRGALGANDIANTQADQINSFLGGQFNTSLKNALTTLPQSRAADAALQLGAGGAQRQLGIQQASAPITGLQQIGQALGILPTNGGSVENQSSFKSDNGTFGNLLGAVGGLFSSDISLKENITPLGQENGHNIYEFSYKGDPKRWIGVMAQEVRDSHPDAVHIISGYLAVDYNAIGVKFREAA